jgi:glycosyltransferase involved in cell wall biosynthesis
MKLSVVFPHINEEQEANATIRSIRETAGDSVEIVVVDDCSTTRPNIIGADNVIFNSQPCGTGPSRHIGAEAATGDYILITDCHMRFTPGWLQAFGRAPIASLDVICGACVQLDEENMDLNKAKGCYHGATFNFFGPDKRNPKNTHILESVWLDKRDAPIYETPSLMGACYFIRRDWYLKLSPHRFLKTWGCEEQALSLKTWLSGGKVCQVNSIRIGHKFRRNPKKLPFKLRVSDVIYNKLFVMFTCLPEEYANALMKKFPRDMDFNLAYQKLRDNWSLVATEQAYNRNLFTVDFSSLLERWQLTCPHG